MTPDMLQQMQLIAQLQQQQAAAAAAVAGGAPLQQQPGQQPMDAPYAVSLNSILCIVYGVVLLLRHRCRICFTSALVTCKPCRT
jgi:hypothetical protein